MHSHGQAQTDHWPTQSTSAFYFWRALHKFPKGFKTGEEGGHVIILSSLRPLLVSQAVGYLNACDVSLSRIKILAFLIDVDIVLCPLLFFSTLVLQPWVNICEMFDWLMTMAQ